MRTIDDRPVSQPCEHCPWRTTNHGKRTPWGFYTKANLTRLWNQLRRGGKPQSCHPTDPRHPDHVAAGAKHGSTPKECPSAVILVIREMERLKESGTDEVTPESIDHYRKVRKRGLTKDGIAYWLISRFQFGRVPILGEGALPNIDIDNAAVSLPVYLEDS